MNAPPTFRRSLAHTLMRCAMRLLAKDNAVWAQAMEHELRYIAEDDQALAWALGCVRAGCSQRVRALTAIEPATAGQLPMTAAVAAVFVGGSIELNAYLATLAYPDWYAQFATAYGHGSLHLWIFAVLGIPEALLAAACAATLARITGNTSTAVVAIALLIWSFAPFAADLLATQISFSAYAHGIAMFWPDVLLRLLLVWVAFVIAYRHGARHKAPQRFAGEG